MIDMPEVAKWEGNRRKIGQDFFQTPKKAVEALLPFIPEDVELIWEPTAGRKAISNVLEDHGFKVINSDKHPQMEDIALHDFLIDDFIKCDMVILNPPFSLKTDFLQRLIESGLKFAFICPLSIIETATRSKIFAENDLSIINLSNRVCYTGKYEKKVFFHSVWVINDGLGKIHYSVV